MVLLSTRHVAPHLALPCSMCGLTLSYSGAAENIDVAARGALAIGLGEGCVERVDLRLELAAHDWALELEGGRKEAILRRPHLRR